MEQTTKREHLNEIPKGVTEINYKKLWGKHYICVKCNPEVLPGLLALNLEAYHQTRNLPR